MKQDQYSKIENRVNVNVFGCDYKQQFPIHLSNESNEDVLNLLLITEGNKQHSVYIKDFNRFMFHQNKTSNRRHFCMHCLRCLVSERILESHKEVFVVANVKQAIKMPPAGSTLNYDDFHKQLDVPFVIYADFEAITEKVSGCAKSDGESNACAYQKHTNCGYGYKMVHRGVPE